MTLGLPIPLATMTPVDWGLTGAAILMLVYAARTFVSGKGKSQMGASFAFVAALVWTLAIGRHLEGFTVLNGFQVAIGVLLLVPVFRVFFKHTGGSIVFAVISMILASVIAGPVVTKFAGQLSPSGSPTIEQMQATIDELDGAIAEKTKTRDAAVGLMGTERAKLEEIGVTTEAELLANPEALAAMQRYGKYKAEREDAEELIALFQERKRDLKAGIAALESGETRSTTTSKSEAERLRNLVESEVARDKPLIERYSERGDMLELFETEFGEPE